MKERKVIKFIILKSKGTEQFRNFGKLGQSLPGADNEIRCTSTLLKR